MVDKLDEALGFFHQALNLRGYRQQVLAANIANADTPNYKARDFDFASALSAAQGAQGTQGTPASGAKMHLAMLTTDSAHLGGSGGASGTGGASGGNPALLYRTTLQMSADGNSVDMDVERAKFADNALHYEASVTFLSNEIKSMQSAVSN
jgi:flagellar basal-body rod protein FlgB